MPLYDFEHVESGEIITVHLDLKQPQAAYQKQERDGKVYRRIYTVPNAAQNILAGTLTQDDFRRVTTDKGLTVGKMQDISREMSADRAAKNGGLDPVKEKFYKDYERKNGVPHIEKQRGEKRAKAKAKLKKFGVEVTV